MVSYQLILITSFLITGLALPNPGPEVPSEDSNGERNVLLEGSFFEGDIRLPKTRNGIINPARRWPGGVIPYVIDSSFSLADRNLINLAIADYHRLTCVRWVQRTSQRDYVYFSRLATGCWSYVGIIGGKQDLNIQVPGCNYKGIIIHEMMHAAGFWHEQSRPDRDQYIRINIENIQTGLEHNFSKLDPTVATTFNVPYDYGSVMHYGPRAFSKNNLPTITPLKSLNGAVMGQRNGFALSDYRRINRMYNCVNYQLK